MSKAKLWQEQQIFCRNILLLRKSHGLSKKEMSQILGISICSLNKIEQGELPPRLSVSVVFQLYKFFGISPFVQSLDPFAGRFINQFPLINE